MTPPTAAPARRQAAQPQRSAPKRPARKPVRHHRRVSGTARPATTRAVAAPRPLPRPSFGLFTNRVVSAVCKLRDSLVVDRLVRGQGWIALLGVLLIGLVGLNVSLLKLNAQNGRSAEVARDLRITNAQLRGTVSRLGSSERLQQAAQNMGLVMPTPQMVNYLTAHPRSDGRRAAKNVKLAVPAPASDQLVSASPGDEQEVLSPTPPQPIVQPAPTPEQAVPAAATGATGATGTATAPGATAPAAPTGTTGATGPTGTPGG